MKVAVTGKGGVGKTTVTAILARTLARSGLPVVAVDADPNPTLGLVLGLGLHQATALDSIANVLIAERAQHDHGADHHSGDHHSVEAPERTAEELVSDISTVGPDGVRLVQTGKIERPSDGCLCCGSHRTTRSVFGEIDAQNRVVIADLEAGLLDLVWAEPKKGDTVLILTDPSRNSLEVATRALRITRELGVDRVLVVANRIDGPGDGERVRGFLTGVDIIEVPEDPSITTAERLGLSPLDASPECDAVHAVKAVAAWLSLS